MRRFVVAATHVVMISLMSMPAEGQALRRTPEGKPDLSGIWQVLVPANSGLLAHPADNGVPASQGVVEGDEIPYTPAAAAKRAENYKKRATADPEAKCYLPGVPRITYMPYPFQIVQAKDQVSILYEYVSAIRFIFMDSQHPKGPLEFWMGDSRGRWEGDTLVVDTIHFNDQTWFDHTGNFHSDALHVVERFTATDSTRINYEVTIEDTTVFTRPWKMSMPLYRRMEPNVQLLEYICFAYDGENARIRQLPRPEGR